MSLLAIEGGTPVRSRPFPAYRTIGEAERRAVLEVLDSGVLSQFVGVDGPDFLGGPRVQALEAAWAETMGARFAVAMNSATSGLYAAVGAGRVGPGDEVIVSPYTMSASAVAAVVYGAIPVFADVDPVTFCLDPESVRSRITAKTRAIIGVDLFGHPAAWHELESIGRAHDLILIEDAAQAPGARLNGKCAGTFGHMGVYSLNYHKTIHCGEGGVVVTDDPDLAERLRLIRNHAEAVVKARRPTDLVNMVGFNYRMTEIEAAIALEQLKKLEDLLAPRIAAADFLTDRLAKLPGISPPKVAAGVRHGYYVYAITIDPASAGCDRDWLVAALRAEGIPLHPGYVAPLYRQPLYREGIAFGPHGFPLRQADGELRRYPDGLCPVTEDLHERRLAYLTLVHAGMTDADLDDVARGFEKVLAHAPRLAVR